MTESSLVGVPADKIGEVWPHVGPMIAAACTRSSGRYTAEGFKRRLLERDQQLWISWNEGLEALAITEIRTYHDTGLKSCIVVVGIGRSRRNWSKFHLLVGEWAKGQGCTLMEAITRPGWARELADFRKTHVTLERAL